MMPDPTLPLPLPPPPTELLGLLPTPPEMVQNLFGSMLSGALEGTKDMFQRTLETMFSGLTAMLKPPGATR